MGLPDIRPTEDIQALRKNISSEWGTVQDPPYGGTSGRNNPSCPCESFHAQSCTVGVPARHVVACDVREQAVAEQALVRFQSLLRSVWENAHDSMRLTDRNGIVTRVNEAYSRFTGSAKDQLENHPFWIIYPRKLSRAFGASTWSLPKRRAHRHGRAHRHPARRKEMSHPAEQFPDPTPQGIWILTIRRDVTEQKDAEDRLHATLAELEASHPGVRRCQPGEIHISGQHEPRNPHADERHSRPRGPCSPGTGRRQAAEICCKY